MSRRASVHCACSTPKVKFGTIHCISGVKNIGHTVFALNLIQDFLRDVHDVKRNLGWILARVLGEY